MISGTGGWGNVKIFMARYSLQARRLKLAHTVNDDCASSKGRAVVYSCNINKIHPYGITNGASRAGGNPPWPPKVNELPV